MLTASTVRIADTFTRELRVPGDGPVHLLLHGFTDSADCYRPLLKRLEDAGAAATAIDLPGFGLAAMPTFDRPMLDVFDDFVAAAVSRYAEEAGAPVILTGNSLGGCFALRAAMNAELPLAGVVPLAPAGPALARWLRAVARGLPTRIVQAERLQRRGLPPRLAARVLAVAYLRVAHASKQTLDRRSARLYLQHQTDGHVMLARGRIALDMYPDILDPWDPAQIRVPTDVVWGRRDRLVRADGAEALASSIEGARATVFEDVGHLPQLEAPDRVAEILLDLAAAASARESASEAAEAS